MDVYHSIPTDQLLLDRFSSYPRALAVIAYVLRFINSIKPKSVREKYSSLALSQSELRASKLLLIKLTQKTYYSDEYNQLSGSKLISTKSSLLTLNPYLDSNGIMRVNGRLANSSLTYDERYPIILPNSSNLCKIFLNFVHKTLMHADISLMMNAVQSQFYIPRLRRTVKKCVHHCLTCVRYKQQVKSQIMAALPTERCSISLPFTYTGVDFAGPFQIKSGNLRNSPYVKGYACVFVCFSTKAIHLEACSSLSSDVFLAAFIRFISRRGLPKCLMSDNGTNFIGASRSFRKEYTLFLKRSAKDISEKYAALGFDWKFIPPGAPHMGGLWEAGVKSFKLHFRRVTGNQRFTFEEFSTLLNRIESVLNSRPISPMSEDPEDLQAITPAHFLHGAPLLFAPELPVDNISIINRWERLKAFHHRFAQRWKIEYLRELHKRYKWKHPQRNLQRGDFVIVKDELLPPCEWKMGRVHRYCANCFARTHLIGGCTSMEVCQMCGDLHHTMLHPQPPQQLTRQQRQQQPQRQRRQQQQQQRQRRQQQQQPQRQRRQQQQQPQRQRRIQQQPQRQRRLQQQPQRRRRQQPASQRQNQTVRRRCAQAVTAPEAQGLVQQIVSALDQLTGVLNIAPVQGGDNVEDRSSEVNLIDLE